jgi:uncharacterized protein YmfQ (DUF2313 family)
MQIFDPKFTEDQYTRFLLNLFPTGPIFPREKYNTLFIFLGALAAELLRIDIRGNDLVRESYAKYTEELIGEWFNAYKLPGVFDEPATLADKINLLLFYMATISNHYIDYGLSEDFYTNLLAESILGYTVIGFNYYGRMAIGPGESGYTATGNTAAASDTITSVSSTAGIEIGHYISVEKGFPIGEHKVLAKTANSIQLDVNATSSETGVALVGYREAPAGMGDGIGERFVASFALKVQLPNSSPAWSVTPASTTAGNNRINFTGSTANVNIGDFALITAGFSDPVQEIVGKGTNYIDVEDDAATNESGVTVTQKTKDNDLLENFINSIKHSHINILFEYS